MEGRDDRDNNNNNNKGTTLLYEASLEGNVIALIELLKQNPLILETTTITTDQNPLHVAALLGHVDFAREILSRKPDLASELDSQGFSPLHLASARKNIEMVRLLVRAEPGVCLSTDNDGRTPLHVATMKGRVEIMKELFLCRPEAINQVVLTNRGETILHLAVNHGRLEAFKLLLQWMKSQGSSVTVNSKDDDGNTVLHLAVAKKQIQIIKLLLLSSDEVEVNALNSNEFTALDILAQNPVSDIKDLEIGEAIRDAGGLRSKDVVSSGTHVVRISRDNTNAPSASATHTTTSSSGWNKHLIEHEKWLEKKQNTLMVVASLIAGMAFQAVLNPPSGFNQAEINKKQTHEHHYRIHKSIRDGIAPTTSAYGEETDNEFKQFMHCNTIGFLASISVNVLLVSGLPINRRVFIWVLMIVLWAATTSMGYAYMTTIDYWFARPGQFAYTFVMWRVLTIFILLMHTTRFILWLLRKKTRRCNRIFLMFWWPIVLGGVFCSVYF